MCIYMAECFPTCTKGTVEISQASHTSGFVSIGSVRKSIDYTSSLHCLRGNCCSYHHIRSFKRHWSA